VTVHLASEFSSPKHKAPDGLIAMSFRRDGGLEAASLVMREIDEHMGLTTEVKKTRELLNKINPGWSATSCTE
jgi:hypothetical protein